MSEASDLLVYKCDGFALLSYLFDCGLPAPLHNLFAYDEQLRTERRHNLIERLDRRDPLSGFPARERCR